MFRDQIIEKNIYVFYKYRSYSQEIEDLGVNGSDKNGTTLPTPSGG